MNQRLRGRGAIAAIGVFTVLVASAQATHWPLAGGDPGRSGFQPADQASLPMKSRWRVADAVQTSPIVTAGANLAAQRVAYGHYVSNESNTDRDGVLRLLQFSNGGAVAQVDLDDEVERDPPAAGPSDDDLFGPPGTGGGDVTPLEVSTHSGAPTQIYVVHNDDNQTNRRPGHASEPLTPNPLGNDIAIAQIRASDGTVRQDVAIGTNNPLSGFSTDGYTIESAPVLGPEDANGTPIVFTIRNASGSDRRIVRIDVANAASDTTGGNTISVPTTGTDSPTVSDNIADLNMKARPTIVYLKDPGSALKVPMVAVGTSDGVKTFRLGNLKATGPAISGLGLTSTVSVPVQSNGNSPTTTPFVYVASAVSGSTVVSKLTQDAGQAGDPSLSTLILAENDGQSPELDGTPGPSLSVAQAIPAGGTPQPGRVLVGTSANLYSLNTENLAAGDPPQLFSQAGTNAFARTSPASSGALGFAISDGGKQFVFDLDDLERPPLNPDTGFQPREETLNSTSGLGQPAVSRGRVVFGSNNGAYAYGSAVTILQPAANSTVAGAITLEAFVYDAALTQVTFRIDGAPVGTAPVTDGKAAITINTATLQEGPRTLLAVATGNGGLEEHSAPRTIIVNNFLNPNAALTVSPNPANVNTEVTLNASGSKPTASEAGETIVRWAFDVDGDNDFDDIVEAAGGDGVVKTTFATPGTKTVKVRVTDSHGDTADAQATVRINAPPAVALAVNPNPVPSGQQATIDASGTTDSDGTIAKYEFDLDGNGTYELDNGTNPKTSKAFTDTTTVAVRVTDNDGGQTVRQATVSVTGGNQPPVASFVVAPNPAEVGKDVGFLATGSKDPDGTIAKYEWDFDGNGVFEIDNGANPLIAHRFPSAGVFRVGLRVTDNAGAQATSTVQVVVAVAARCSATKRCAPGLTVSVSPKRDRKLPYRFTTKGRLRLPTGLRTADGCQGRVLVQVKLGRKTISSRRLTVRRTCRFSGTVSFRNRKRLGKASSLRFSVRFQGNKVLTPKSAKVRKVRIG